MSRRLLRSSLVALYGTAAISLCATGYGLFDENQTGGLLRHDFGG